MHYDQFVGQVQHRARLASRGDAVRAIHATFYSLAERISAPESADLIAQLPEEIGFYLRRDAWRSQESFSLHEFYNRVASRERSDYPEAVFHARVVMQVLSEAVSAGEMKDVRAQLPTKFGPLFELPAEHARAEAEYA